MKRTVLLCVAIVGSTTLQGCSLWELKYGKDKPSISYTELPSNEKDKDGRILVYDKVYAWRPDSSVAYIFQDQINGKHPACIASADVAKSTTTSDALTLSLEKVMASQGTVDAGAAQTVAEQLTVLTNKGAAGAFLNVALFNICMLNGSGQLDHNDLVQLVTHALDIAGKIAVAQPNEPAKSQEQKPVTAQAEIDGHSMTAGSDGASATIKMSSGDDPSKSEKAAPQK